MIDTDWILVAVITFLLMLMTSGEVSADDWTKADTARQTAYSVLLGLDMLTTLDIKNHDDTHENGVITRQLLGRNPETLPTVTYFAAVGVLNYAVARNLPKEWRPTWQTISAVFAGGHVINNWRIGLRPAFE